MQWLYPVSFKKLFQMFIIGESLQQIWGDNLSECQKFAFYSYWNSFFPGGGLRWRKLSNESIIFKKLVNGNWNILKSLSLSLQAIINSTILPNMTFTKTSQKFGQWSDPRANTVFGLGFPSEAELNKVSIF